MTKDSWVLESEGVRLLWMDDAMAESMVLQENGNDHNSGNFTKTNHLQVVEVRVGQG